jgi:hypothetical protein
MLLFYVEMNQEFNHLQKPKRLAFGPYTYNCSWVNLAAV